VWKKGLVQKRVTGMGVTKGMLHRKAHSKQTRKEGFSD
jgi:hypothetical protein